MMNALAPMSLRPAAAPAMPIVARYEDPLDEDMSSDRSVTATRRGLTRLALIAAETGARFQREGEGHDPMAWLLAPRRLFGGGTAIDAVLEREDFMRALLLHGLSIGLDADPAAIDRLACDGPEDDGDGFCDCGGDGQPRHCGCGDGDEGADASDPDDGADDGWYESASGEPRYGGSGLAVAGRKLFTATLVHHDEGGTQQAFHASVCMGAVEAVRRLTWRYGAGVASAADVKVGFDPTTAMAEALVSPAVGHMLALVAAEPESPLASGLDFNLEQRFAA